MSLRDEDLRHRQAPLAMSPDDFRECGHRLVDAIADHLAGLPSGPVNHDVDPTDVRRLLPEGSLPARGAAPADLLDEAWRALVGHSLFNGHPRFFGYITSSAAPIGALADLAASSVNANCGGWQLSPVASEIERQCVRWIAELLGVPFGDGLLVSGGNVANISGFLAGRRAQAGEGLSKDGVDSAGGRWLVYASAETHTWIQKAADLSGLGTDAVRWVATTADRRLDVAALRRQLAEDLSEGHRPFMLVGTAGTVATGAVDPLDELADVAVEHRLWFHVDGAYGAFARLVPDEAERFAGMERADSVAVDPHKWLYAPLEAGCVIVRDPAALTDTFGYTPSYYRFTGEDEDPRVNFYERGLQNSRGFRSLKVWLGLRQAGREGLARMIEDDCRLARALHRAVEATPELEAAATGLSIATFRYVPEGFDASRDGAADELDTVNEELLARLKVSGEVFLSNAELDGRFFLRACVCNFRTSLADVEAVPEIVVRHGRAIQAGA